LVSKLSLRKYEFSLFTIFERNIWNTTPKKLKKSKVKLCGHFSGYYKILGKKIKELGELPARLLPWHGRLF